MTQCTSVQLKNIYTSGHLPHCAATLSFANHTQWTYTGANRSMARRQAWEVAWRTIHLVNMRFKSSSLMNCSRAHLSRLSKVKVQSCWRYSCAPT